MVVRKNIVKNNNKKKFRLSAKKLFLTYSRCDLELDIILEYFKKKFKKMGRELENYFLVREFHKIENEENCVETHVHIFFEFDFRFDTKNPKFLDVIHNDVCYHGNYQVVKSKLSTIKYLLKDFSTFDSNDSLISKNLNKYITSSGNFLDIYSLMVKLGKEGLIEEALELLSQEKPKEFLNSQLKLEKSLQSVYLKPFSFK